jgi:hypothetical protein
MAIRFDKASTVSMQSPPVQAQISTWLLTATGVPADKDATKGRLGKALAGSAKVYVVSDLYFVGDSPAQRIDVMMNGSYYFVEFAAPVTVTAANAFQATRIDHASMWQSASRAVLQKQDLKNAETQRRAQLLAGPYEPLDHRVIADEGSGGLAAGRSAAPPK